MPQMRNMDTLTAGCLFSGMGGFASGLAAAGFAVAWASDNNEYACRTFRHRFSGTRVIEKDARELSVDDDGLAPVDVLAAGFPCQSFSQAGDRRGFEDERGEVFFQIPRLLNEWAPEQRPKLLILENVPPPLLRRRRLVDQQDSEQAAERWLLVQSGAFLARQRQGLDWHSPRSGAPVLGSCFQSSFHQT